MTKKLDTGKLRYDLIPFEALEKVVDVLTQGAARYGAQNWRTVPEAKRRYLAAALRHLTAYARGEEIDPDWDLPHLAHCVASLLFLLELKDEVPSGSSQKEV